MNKSIIRSAVRGFYDLQKLRIQTGLRVVAAFKVQLGQEPSTSEDDLPDDAKKILADLRRDYDLITDAIVGTGKKIRAKKPELFRGSSLISNESEYELVSSYIKLDEAEANALKGIEHIVKDSLLWKEFLVDVKGCGPTMAAVILSEIDIHKAQYPSSIWAYAGLDVAANGKGRSRKAEHLVKVSYTDKEGKAAERNGITFNPFLKTKMVGVLGSSFVKAGGKYRDIYDGYKNRLQNRPDLAEESKGHINNMAIRYAVKMFILDLYTAWRTLEGLPVSEPYHVAKLGLRDHRKAA